MRRNAATPPLALWFTKVGFAQKVSKVCILNASGVEFCKCYSPRTTTFGSKPNSGAPGEWEPYDCNSDVKVSFEKGVEWIATFFTYKNISTLAKRNEITGECLNGKYFCATDMILVDELSRQRVEEVVSNLISEGEFESAFTRALV